MTTPSRSAIGALDSFFDVVRRKANLDPAFAAELVKALDIPIEISIKTSADVAANIVHLDPFVIAGRGLDEFRRIYGAMKDADVRKIITTYNLASADAVKAKGGPKGPALVTLMWDAAKAQRDRMEGRQA